MEAVCARTESEIKREDEDHNYANTVCTGAKEGTREEAEPGPCSLAGSDAGTTTVSASELRRIQYFRSCLQNNGLLNHRGIWNRDEK